MLRCCACSRTFASASALQAHEQSHFEGPPRGEHCCAECGKGFASYRGLRMHQRKHLRASQVSAVPLSNRKASNFLGGEGRTGVGGAKDGSRVRKVVSAKIGGTEKKDEEDTAKERENLS